MIKCLNFPLFSLEKREEGKAVHAWKIITAFIVFNALESLEDKTSHMRNVYVYIDNVANMNFKNHLAVCFCGVSCLTEM